jgi:Protein of unknown function (DUF4199)
MNFLSTVSNIQLRYAGVASVLGIALILVFFAVHKHPFLIPVFFDFRIVLFAVFLFVSLREFRDLSNDGVLYFWQGMIGSFVFVVEYAVVVAIAIMVIGSVNHSFVTEYVDQFSAQARAFPQEVIAERIGKEAFEQNLKALKSTTIGDLALLYFVQCLMIGCFVSIILSVILRRSPKTL